MFYPSSKITFGANFATKGIYFVLVELWNDGRGIANQPVIETSVFKRKITKTEEYSGRLESDVAILDSLPSPTGSVTYDHPTATDDRLASQFYQKGLTVVDYLPGRKSGKKMVFGIAFENGKTFYLPPRETLEMPTLPIGDGQEYFCWFAARAKNFSKKTVAKNVKLTLPKWNEIKLDYHSRDADLALAQEAYKVLLGRQPEQPAGS